MRILIDTHILIWWLDDNDRLSTPIRKRIANPDNQIFISAISIFEISMKMSLGKLSLGDSLEKQLQINAIDTLPFSLNHALTAETLPWHHRDPFDRMLIAQSLSEKMPIISCDEQFIPYNISLIRA
jgi:PIN domain nuclease of toxin-antitoxin system